MKVLIIGAGGHARVIADALLCRTELGEKYEIVGFLDDNTDLRNKGYLGVRILGNISEASEFDHEAVVIGIGDNAARKKLYLKFKEMDKKIITVIHPQAVIGTDVEIADGTVIFANVVVNSGARIGSNVILNTACTVGHDVVLCSHTQIGPGVNLGGGVQVGEGAFIGIGSSVNQQMKIGDWSVVGAGAAVVHDIPANITVVGVPAMPIQKQTLEEKSNIKDLNRSIPRGSGAIFQSDNVEEWHNILKISYQFDFYHTLEYHLICEENGQGKPILFVYQDSNCKIGLPLLIRPIHNEAWFPKGHKEAFDVTSVYGYTGPLLSEKDVPQESVKQFSISLITALRELHVISLFSRLHPLIDIGSSFDKDFNRRVIGETVSIDLSIPSESQVAQFCDNHKRGIKKLTKEGFQCFEDVSQYHLDDFIHIYNETMDRVSAEALYYFPREYFLMLFEKLNDKMHLFVCKKDNEIACAGIFSLCSNIIQYHLGGTRNNYLKYSPMKLLFNNVREWGIKNHAASFHLGGGLGSIRDSLLQFKAGFSNRRHEFAVWGKIISTEEYKILCDAKADYNKRNNLQNINESFFPQYRSQAKAILLDPNTP
jgi:sugar O-acyltransferase (sialic acid O-acetyltransferase NeuD family)